MDPQGPRRGGRDVRGSSLAQLKGQRGSGVVCINGAAAHLNQPGDLVIIATFAQVSEKSARQHRPTVVLVDEFNRIKVPELIEIPGPDRRHVA